MALVLHVPRDIYESYALYNFLALSVDYMGGNTQAQAYIEKRPPLEYAFPCRCCGDHSMGLFLDSCRIGILQYAVISPCTAILTLSLHWSGHFDEETYDLHSSNLWITVINNTSVTIALYYMVEFYRAAHLNPSLKAARPLSKFLTIKAIIFLTFFQTFSINVLFALGLINTSVDHERASGSFSDFLICIEMAFMSVIHCFVWPASEHRFGYYPLISIDNADQGVQVVAMDMQAATKNMIGLSDLCQDLFVTAKSVPALSQSSISSAVGVLQRAYQDPRDSVDRNDSREVSRDSRMAQFPHNRYRWKRSESAARMEEGSTQSSHTMSEIAELENEIQCATLSAADRLTLRARLAALEHHASEAAVLEFQRQAAEQRYRRSDRRLNETELYKIQLSECTDADVRMDLHAKIAQAEHEESCQEDEFS